MIWKDIFIEIKREMLNIFAVVHLNEADNKSISGIHALSNGTLVVISEKYALKQYNVVTGELLFHKRLSTEPRSLSEVTLNGKNCLAVSFG